MDRKLRPFVTGLDAARLAPDRPAVLGEIRELLGAHAGCVKLTEQAEFDQLANRMRQHVDADAERLQRRDAFEDFGGNPDLVQAERQRQPADAAAGDEYGHDHALVTDASWHGRGMWATAKPDHCRRTQGGRRNGTPLTSSTLGRIKCSRSITLPVPARSLRISRLQRPASRIRPRRSISKATSRTARNISGSTRRGAFRRW